MYKFYFVNWYTLNGHTKSLPSDNKWQQIVKEPNLKYWLIRINFICFLLFLAFLQMASAANGQNVSLIKKSTSISGIFKEIKKQTGYNFVVQSDLLKNGKRVNIEAKNEPIRLVLDKCFANQSFDYTVINNTIIVKQKDKATVPQNNDIKILFKISVSGKVTDTTGAPLPGATVKVKGGIESVAADANGKFNLTVPDHSILIFSFIGFANLELPAVADKEMVVALKPNKGNLSEVMVVGYGTQRKATLTGAVEQVRGSELEKAPVANLTNSLAGRLPGLVVTQGSGEPGSDGSNINIRGLGAPLIIVDGVPGDLSQINASEVEGITMLKDASANVYGFRASNGVMLVTTKRGKIAAPEISYSGYYGWQSNATSYAKLVNAGQYTELYDEAVINDQIVNNKPLKPTYGAEEVAKWQAGTDPNHQSTDYYKTLLKNSSSIQQHTLNVRGGTENTQYFLSAGAMFQNGLLQSDATKFKRYNFRSNVTSKIANNLTAGLNVAANFQNLTSPLSTNPFSLFNDGIQRAAPTLSPYANNNPNYFSNNGGSLLAKSFNDYAGSNNPVTHSIQTQGYLNYKIITGLDARVTYAYNFNNISTRSFNKAYNLYTYNAAAQTYTPTAYNGLSSLKVEDKEEFQSVARGELNYLRTFGNKHNLKVLALYERTETNKTNVNGYRQFTLENLYQLDLGNATNQTTGGKQEQTAYASFVGKVNYDYMGKYLLEVGGRYDGSFKLPPLDRYALFPYVTAGWLISQESWFKVGAINSLKLRASWGIAGNDGNLDADQYTTGYGLEGSYVLTPGAITNGLRIAKTPNYLLTWVKSTSENIGFDAGLFNDAVTVSVDVFNRSLTGIGANPVDALPSTSGLTLGQQNFNSNRTRGFEFSFSYNKKIGDLSFSIAPNISYTRTKDVKVIASPFTNALANYNGNGLGEDKFNKNNRYQNFQFGYVYTGRFTSMGQIAAAPIQDGNGNQSLLPGDLMYADLNNDGIIDGNDQKVIGRGRNPEIFYGLNLTASWKNFDISVLLQGATNYKGMLEGAFRSPFNNGGSAYALFTDRWHREDIYNPNSAWIPGEYPSTRLGGLGSNTRVSSFWMVDAWYLRVKTLDIGYSLGKQALSHIGLKQVRVYVSSQNLLTFTNLKYTDPEAGTQDIANASADDNNNASNKGNQGFYYPQQKVVNLGVQIKF
jgi:TonB-linked SusC/RagA family outer membrane protein